MNFEDRLKELRNKKGITQDELARSIYVSRSLIARYENGSALPTKENIERIAVYFNVELSDLIDTNQTIEMSLKNVQTVKNINLGLNVSNLIVNAIYVILSVIPFLKTWKYVYPIPPGQSSPTIEYFYTSIMMSSFSHDNYIGLVTIIICIISFALALSTIIVKYERIKITLQLFSYVGFVISIFMIVFSLIFGIGYL